MRLGARKFAHNRVAVVGRPAAADDDLAQMRSRLLLREDVGDPIGDVCRPVVNGDDHRQPGRGEPEPSLAGRVRCRGGWSGDGR